MSEQACDLPLIPQGGSSMKQCAEEEAGGMGEVWGVFACAPKREVRIRNQAWGQPRLAATH